MVKYVAVGEALSAAIRVVTVPVCNTRPHHHRDHREGDAECARRRCAHHEDLESQEEGEMYDIDEEACAAVRAAKFDINSQRHVRMERQDTFAKS